MAALASAAPHADNDRRFGVSSVLAGWLIAMALLAVTWVPLASQALRSGTLVDNDDAMRLVEVREFMDGKSWFDLTQTRVNPPDSPVSHWSRLIDLPLATIAGSLTLLVDRTTAERLMTVIWPTILLAVFVLCLLSLARRLFPPVVVIAGGVIVGLNLVLTFQFAPGRIDHHDVQMLLTFALGAAAARAMTDREPVAAALAGGAAALMLAIGLETLPFVAMAGIAFGVWWVIEGAASRRAVGAFGAAFGLCTLLLCVMTIAPSRWSAPACDAISLPWLWLALAGGGTLVCFALLAPPRSPVGRVLWTIPAAVIVVGVFCWRWSECLAGPYASVDPVVRELWLSSVGEATPILGLVKQDPGTFLFFFAFPLIGYLGLLAATFAEGRREPLFPLFLAFASVGLVVTWFQMRGASFAAIFGLFGWLYLLRVGIASARERRPTGYALPVLALLGALPFAWNALGAVAEPSPASAAVPQSQCGLASNLTVLAEQKPGLVLAPAELGPRILVSTPHSVLAAPYHRNNAGNRTALDALTGDEAVAFGIIRARAIDYVAICVGASSTQRLATHGSHPFVQQLLDGAIPSWLVPIGQIGPIRAWRVAESAR